MHHVYYRQQYQHPQLGRALRVEGTALSLHFAPDGSLRRANLAQVTDVSPLPQVAVTSSQQAFNAMQIALAGRPGHALGTPAAWPAGTMSLLLDNAELTLVPPRGDAGHRLQWRLTTLDAALFPWKVVVDATDGSLVSLTPGAAAGCWPYHAPCPDCQGQSPDDVLAKAEPESVDLLKKDCGPSHDDYCFCGPSSYSCDDNGLRHVAANPCSSCAYYRYTDQPQESCSGPCTHEAVRAAYPGDPEHPPTPQIEVYQGMNDDYHHLPCGSPSEGKYMRLGLKEQGGDPFYGIYGGGVENKGLSGAWVPHPRMRRQAGDAMFNTIKTMEQLYTLFGWCGVTGSCSDPVRIVVDQPVANPYRPPGAFFNPGPGHTLAPVDSVYVERVPSNPSHDWPDRAHSAALDVIAHAWGHGVDKYGSAKFASRCSDLEPEVCQMSEGFSDGIGLDAAAEILFRVLVVEADTGTSDWDELPYLARGAVRDLFSVEECPAIQRSVFDAFEAVGYPEAVARPCVMCGPIQACPPCCPPPCCDEQQEE